jgi:hypothetical protein
LEGRHEIAIEKMDPVFPMSPEAKAETARLLKERTSEFIYHSITNYAAYYFFEGTNSMHFIIPYVSEATIGTQRATVKSYLLATKYDGATTWYFISIGTKRGKELAKYYPGIPLSLPRGQVITNQSGPSAAAHGAAAEPGDGL